MEVKRIKDTFVKNFRKRLVDYFLCLWGLSDGGGGLICRYMQQSVGRGGGLSNAGAYLMGGGGYMPSFMVCDM